MAAYPNVDDNKIVITYGIILNRCRYMKQYMIILFIRMRLL